MGGAACAFGNAGICGEAYEQAVTKCASLAQVADMARMDDVKAAVALDKFHAVSAHRLAYSKELLKGEDLDLRRRGHV